LDTQRDYTLFEKSRRISFLTQVDAASYIYVEDMPDGKYARWVERKSEDVSYLSKKSYNLATIPTITHDEIFILIPSKPPIVDVLKGRPSEFFRNFIGETTESLKCSTGDILTCVRIDTFYEIHRSFSKVYLGSKKSVCQIGATWSDPRSLSISRNGKIAAFTAKIDGVIKVVILKPFDNCAYSFLAN